MEATFQLPEPLLDELLERSQKQGRSLDDVAVDLLWRGIDTEHADNDWTAALGSFILSKPTGRFDRKRLEAHLAELPEGASDLSQELDWARSDRHDEW